jgi:hypothetical protein
MLFQKLLGREIGDQLVLKIGQKVGDYIEQKWEMREMV